MLTASGMRRRPGRGAAWQVLVLAVVAGSACEVRARLGPRDTGDDQGPRVTIDRPAADTTVNADATIFVQVTVTDPDYVDTVYVRTLGPGPSFQPFVADPEREMVRLGLPIGTFGLANDTIVVQVFATDHVGARGDTAVRELRIP